MSKKRFTLRELEDNNVEVLGEVLGPPYAVTYAVDTTVWLVPCGGDLYELPPPFKLVTYHGYWLVGK